MQMLLKTLIDKYDIICFDIFDTLIERTVDKPSIIFDLVGSKVLDKGQRGDFRIARINAERRAREKSTSGEVTLDDIYLCLPEEYKDGRTKLKNAEMELELDYCVRKKSMIAAYECCMLSNKSIFLISDMYLPETLICRMLDKCGVTGFKKIYISNVYGCNKISGKLFEIVMRENNVKKDTILHIGDSVKADFLGARKVGIHSYLIRRKNRIRRLLL